LALGFANPTHACFEPKELTKNNPRGSKSLLGPLLRFGVQDTLDWLQSRGVALKTKDDERMFPTTERLMRKHVA
jgi:predicted flavoprotein YhiN